MILRSSVRWRLVAWVTGVLLAVLAVVFAVVYEQTGDQLRTEINSDVAGDVGQLAEAVRTIHATSAQALLKGLQGYINGKPLNGTSTLLFARVQGYGTISDPPELSGDATPDGDETIAQQAAENAESLSAQRGPTGLSTREVPDVGQTRFDERVLVSGPLHVRIGAGEPLIIVVRAERSIAKSFLIAGALALILALLASYLAGASVSSPLRRLARVAARIDDGDLSPRMEVSALAGREVRVLAESINHMLDRLSEAFAGQRSFIADASHELRTPLTVIAGQLEVLAAQDRPAPDEVRRVQRLVAAEVSRTSRLVDDMLLLARAERTDFLRCEEIDVAPFVHELWLGASVSDIRRFELGELPKATLTADPDRLAQALRNLIRNAVEHTREPDGLVRLDLEALSNGRLRFVVTDDGPGIDDAQLERVFQRFHRTDAGRTRSAGGAGLGLAIVLAIAEAHGGTARAVASERGARLEFELPALVLEQDPGAEVVAGNAPRR